MTRLLVAGSMVLMALGVLLVRGTLPPEAEAEQEVAEPGPRSEPRPVSQRAHRARQLRRVIRGDLPGPQPEQPAPLEPYRPSPRLQELPPEQEAPEEDSAMVQGRVVSGTGRPLSHVVVELRREPPPGKERPRARSWRATTGFDGRFAVHLPTGWYQLRARPQLQQSKRFPVQRRVFASAEPQPELVVLPGPAVGCRLQGRGGRQLPVRSVFVTLERKGHISGFGIVSSGRLGAAFNMPWPAGTKEVQVQLGGGGYKGSVTLRAPDESCVIAARPR
jgi:hypothetical protein